MAGRSMTKAERAESPDDFIAVVRAAEDGDSKAATELREIMRDEPELAGMLGGNLAKQLDKSLIADAAGNNLAFKEAMKRRLETMRADLAGPTATPLERLLVERIATCWLHLHLGELRYAQAKDLTFVQVEYHEKRQERAQRRYLSAIKMLAVVRRLLRPVVQVNIAEQQQVNVGSWPERERFGSSPILTNSSQ